MLYKSAQILLICPENDTNYILFIFNALDNFLQLETHGHVWTCKCKKVHCIAMYCICICYMLNG